MHDKRKEGWLFWAALERKGVVCGEAGGFFFPRSESSQMSEFVSNAWIASVHSLLSVIPLQEID
jgi:hypothetical protein